MIVPMCLRSTDRPINELYIQLLSPPNARTVLLPELISSAPIRLWNYDLLTRPRADMPASLNLSLTPYCYYNRPLLPCLQLTSLCCFISSRSTLAAPPAAKYNTSLRHCSQLTPAALPVAKQIDPCYFACSTTTDFYCFACGNNCI